MRKRTKKQLSTKPSHTDIAAPMIGLTVTMPELHILQVASVYRLHRRDGGWWWPVGHPIWGQEVEPIPVFPPIGVENGSSATSRY